jgi:hypothetical protein
MFTDPMISYWRLEKHFERYMRIQRTYPLPLIQKPLALSAYPDNGISSAMNLIFDFITEKSSVLVTGFYAYNYYLHCSDYKKYNKNYDYINIPYLEAYSTNYVSDGLDIIEFIKSMPENLSSKITHKEYFPFFQFYGYNFVLYYNDGTSPVPILYFYSNNKRCIPYKQVDYIKFDNLNKSQPIVNSQKKINMGCFDHNILHAIIILVKVRVDEDNDWNDIIYKYINGLVTFRNYYLEKRKETIYSDTVFQGFVIDCMGETLAPDRERRLVIEARKKLGKPYVYKYDPSVSKAPARYKFMNSSGNQITKQPQLKLTKENLSKQLSDEFEAEEMEDNLDTEDAKDAKDAKDTKETAEDAEDAEDAETVETVETETETTKTDVDSDVETTETTEADV